MGKLQKNQKGFTVLEVLLLLIFLAIIGFIGVYVAHNHKTDSLSTTTSTNIKTSNTPVTKKVPVDPYANWKSATLQYEKISYKYPSDWTIKDTSDAHPKSDNGCAYPGHDKIKLTSPSGGTFEFNAGQACFGYMGDASFGSEPVKALGQDLYIGFLGYADPVTPPTKPDSACLVQSAVSKDRFESKSKNIFFNSPSNNPTSNEFCFTPGGAIDSADSIKNSADYRDAKLIFESMSY